MIAFYIGQHEIDDEAAFADYLKQTMPFIEKHGGRYLTKAGTHEMLEGLPPSRASSLSNFRAKAGDQGSAATIPATARRSPNACGGAQHHDRGGGPAKLYVRFGSKADIPASMCENSVSQNDKTEPGPIVLRQR